MPRPFGSTIDLPADLRRQLQALVRARSTPQALVFRCRILLRAADDDQPPNHLIADELGCDARAVHLTRKSKIAPNHLIADELGCDRHTVGLWRERFVARGLEDSPRSGRPRIFSPRRACGRSRRGQ